MRSPSSTPPGLEALYPGRVSRNTAFVAAACAFVFVFAAAGTPIPLYNTYRLEDGITNGDLAIVSVAYFIAAASSLLVCGRLSNHVGRRPVALTALVCATLGCVVLATMHSVTPMLIGRLLQGFACGITSSSLGAYVVDTSVGKPRWLAAAITGSAPMLGIPVGALTSGALVEWGPEPRVMVYAVMVVVLVLLAAIIALSPETVAVARVRRPLCGRTCRFRRVREDWSLPRVPPLSRLGLWEASIRHSARLLPQNIWVRRTH